MFSESELSIILAKKKTPLKEIHLTCEIGVFKRSSLSADTIGILPDLWYDIRCWIESNS